MFNFSDRNQLFYSFTHRPEDLSGFWLKKGKGQAGETYCSTSSLSYLFYLSLDTDETPLLWKCVYMLRLFKGGLQREVNNYRPISKLSALVKVLKTLMCEQLKEFVTVKTILDDRLSSTCLDMFKAFDTAEHDIMMQKCIDIRLSKRSGDWFENYLTNR